MDTRQFVNQEIITGLRRLILLRLEATPAKDTVRMVGQVWITSFYRLKINWTEEKDRFRIQQAFDRFIDKADSSNRFPTPRQIIDLLPPRIPPLMLNAPKLTEEEIAAKRAKQAENRKRLQQTLEILFKKMEMPK